MKQLILLLSAAVTIFSCKNGEKEDPKNYISIHSLIEEQIAHVDTSLYMIMRIESRDSLNDTSYIHRENFREVSKEFLAIPDLSNSKVAKRYKEEAAQYDELLNRVIITYSAIDPKKEEYIKQELTVTPSIATGDKVNTVLINRVINTRDSFMQKNMLWRIDKSFLITTFLQKPGEPEKVSTVRVTWNEDND